MLTEQQITQILLAYYRPPEFWAVPELRIKNLLAIPQLTIHHGGQQQIQIDLAVQSQHDKQLVFIEAERVLALDHPILYRPFAHYVYLAAPEEAIQKQPKVIQHQQFQLARQKKIGVLGVQADKKVIVHVSAEWCAVHPYVYATVCRVLQKKWTQQKRIRIERNLS
ncbi:MAG: hypothetical protein ACFFDI_00070 [Promethearchaeota archaeon]